jgi:hypothetical protein
MNGNHVMTGVEEEDAQARRHLKEALVRLGHREVMSVVLQEMACKTLVTARKSGYMNDPESSWLIQKMDQLKRTFWTHFDGIEEEHNWMESEYRTK